MSKSQVQNGKMLDMVAPTGGVVSGLAYLFAGLLVVAQTTVAQTLKFAGASEGVHTLPKEATAAVFAVGEKVYWDNTNKRCDETDTGFFHCGTCVEAAGATDTTVKVKLLGFATAAEA